MVTPPEHTKSSEIGTATTDIKELQKNPILIPISDYIKGSIIYEKEDEREISNLQSAMEILKELQKTGIYEDSKIALAYKEVVQIYQRIAWIYKKNVSLANSQISQIKKTTESFYVTRQELQTQIEILEEELKSSKDPEVYEPSFPTTRKERKDQQASFEETDEEENKFLERKINSGS